MQAWWRLQGWRFRLGRQRWEWWGRHWRRGLTFLSTATDAKYITRILTGGLVLEITLPDQKSLC
eukprot:scaffold732_cov202-Prasinococcus_capsulatus_cf.AAC.1